MAKQRRTAPDSFSPREFLRARRPDSFSDSWTEEKGGLDRSLLEYHLSSITNRSQEVAFEEFARALAEREVCPNLVPQTGPTGGGDGKADTETYPVADALSLCWFEGVGREASSERWAFAVSAKKKWGEKVRADVASIVDTKRGYEKIFFVSNQYIRSKDRTAAEDELSKKYGVEVRILERTWILDKVFQNKREELAIQKLGISVTRLPQVRKGALDLQRERDLEETEARIEEAVTAEQYSLRLADDSMTAALLSRALEKPRYETEGRFERADRIVRKCGLPHQCFRVAYDRAQTAFWWYEDFPEFVSRYSAMEDRVRDSWNTYDFELLTNLWIMLHGLAQRKPSPVQKSFYEEKSAHLLAEFERLAAQEDRPSSVAQANTLKILVKIFRADPDSEQLAALLSELGSLIRDAEGLAGYPLVPLISLLAELEEVFDEIPGYSQLFTQIIGIAGTRKSEVASALMLVRSGQNQLFRDRPQRAIIHLGMALGKLYKNESRRELIRALYLCGRAYERLGLFWAARGSLLIAASLSTDDLFAKGELSLTQLACFNRMKWVELQLGRVPHLLMWHEMDRLLAHSLSQRDEDVSAVEQSEMQFDFSLALLLLKADFWELKGLKSLPDTLDHMGLPAACDTLLFALGDEEKRWQPEDNEESLEALLLEGKRSGRFSELPARALFYERRGVEMFTNLMGCTVTLDCENRHPCIELGESILAAAEAFFATSSMTEVIAKEPSCTIRIKHGDFTAFPFEYKIETRDGHPHFEILCAEFSHSRLSPAQMSSIKEKLLECMANLLARILWINRPIEDFLRQLCGDENGLQRALDFTGSFVALGNLVGANPKERISAWVSPNTKEYVLRRSTPWDHELPISQPAADESASKRRVAAVVESPHIKQSQMEVISPIRTDLWDRAAWSATVFAISPDPRVPPIMAPAFADRALAKDIFSSWRREIGKEDANEIIRVSIVRGISRTEPYSYRVIIGPNHEAAPRKEVTRYLFFVSRINGMHPASPRNLIMFEKNFKSSGSYYLAPAVYTKDDGNFELLEDDHLLKREVHFRDAWSIGPNDTDGAAVYDDDDPIVPSNVAVPPYKELLKWKKHGFGLEGS